MKIMDRERMRLNGPVRTVRTETAQYDENLIERPWLVQTETFDEQGCLLRSSFHNCQHPEYSQDFEHIPETASGADQRLLTYHANGKKAEETFIIPELPPNTVFDFTLSSDANIDYDRSFSCDGARQFKTFFDLEEHPKEIQFLGQDGKLLGKVIFTTDAAGRIIKDAQYSYSGLPASIPEGTEIPPELIKLLGGEIPLSSTEVVYDDNGRRIEEITDLAGIASQRRLFSYDAKGNLIEEATYKEGTLQVKGHIEYDYDSMDNWTKKLVLSWKKSKGGYEPSLVDRRIITYYD
jgi:antitoxin component YwqK of YwqJK toxin-antitoxin module